MEAAAALERDRKYEQAIAGYRSALERVDSVTSELRKQARIAAHNRIAACYREQGRLNLALREFRVSARLGDSVYAPKAVQAITLQMRIK
jgi:phage shock protein A